MRRAARHGIVALVAVSALAMTLSMTGPASAASLARAGQTAKAGHTATTADFPCANPKKACREYTLTFDKATLGSIGSLSDPVSLYGDVTINGGSDHWIWSYGDGDGPSVSKGYQLELRPENSTYTTYVQTDDNQNPVWNPSSFTVSVSLKDDDDTWWNPFSYDDTVVSGDQVIDPAAYYSDPFWFDDPFDPAVTPLSDEVVFGKGGGSLKLDFHWTPGKIIQPTS